VLLVTNEIGEFAPTLVTGAVTVIGTEAVAPGGTEKVAPVDAMVKVWLVVVTGRLTGVVADPELVPLAVPLTLITNVPVAILAGVKIVSCTV
jgi:hypothetical protein